MRAAFESRAHFSCTGISGHINTFLVGFSYFSCFSLSSTLLNRSLLRDDVPKALHGRSRTCPVGAFPVLQSRFALALDQARSLKLLQSLLRPQELLYSIRDLQKSHSNIRDCGFVGFSRAFGMEEKKKNQKKGGRRKNPPTRPAATRLRSPRGSGSPLQLRNPPAGAARLRRQRLPGRRRLSSGSPGPESRPQLQGWGTALPRLAALRAMSFEECLT